MGCGWPVATIYLGQIEKEKKKPLWKTFSKEFTAGGKTVGDKQVWREIGYLVVDSWISHIKLGKEKEFMDKYELHEPDTDDGGNAGTALADSDDGEEVEDAVWLGLVAGWSARFPPLPTWSSPGSCGRE